MVGYAFAYGATLTLSGSHATGNVTWTGTNVGGLIGYGHADNSNNSSTINITNSYHNTGDVQGANNVGGLLGLAVGNAGYSYVAAKSAAINISGSYAAGNVAGRSMVGGLVGYAYAYAHDASSYGGDATIAIANSRATGNVNASSDYVGGLIGRIYARASNSPATVSVSGSYSTGAVSGANYAGGLVGY